MINLISLLNRNEEFKLASKYQEKIFTRLSATETCVLKSIGLYIKLLELTSKKNLLAKAYQLDLNCEFILCAFKCLTYFTYKIEVSYLNMYELSFLPGAEGPKPRLS